MLTDRKFSIVLFSLLVFVVGSSISYQEAAAADVTWDGGAATDDWNDALNWDTDTVPATGDKAIITGGVTVHFTGTTGTTFSGSLQVDNGNTLELDTPTVSGINGIFITGTYSNAGTIIQNQNSVTQITSGGTGTNSGTLTLSGGAFSATGTFTNTSTGLITVGIGIGGNFFVTGSTTTNNGTIDIHDTLNIGGSGPGGGQLDNNSQINILSGAVLRVQTNTPAVTLNNNALGVIDVEGTLHNQSTATLNDSGAINLYCPGTFTDDGLGGATAINLCPTLSNVTISSDGNGGIWAKEFDNISLTFDSSVTIPEPAVNISGENADTVNNVVNAWTAEREMDTEETEGPATIIITFTDAKDNPAPTSPVTTIGTGSVTIDFTAPLASTIPDLTPVQDSGRSDTDNITMDTILTFSGNIPTGPDETGSTLEIYDGPTPAPGEDSPISTTAITAGNNWNSGFTSASADVTFLLTAFITDPAGNLGAASPMLTVVVDNTDPAIPTGLDLNDSDDSGRLSDDNITENLNPRITGDAVDGLAIVKLSSNIDGDIGSQTTDGTGAWEITTGASPLAEGSHTVTATAEDEAGNVSDPSDPLSPVLELDDTDPSASLLSRTPFTGGIWNNNDVIVTYDCSDNPGGSGLDEPGDNDCGADTVSTEGAGQSRSGTAVDLAGNSAIHTETNINIDKTLPLVSVASVLPAPNGNDWNDSDVTVTFGCSDEVGGSGVATTTAPDVISKEDSGQSSVVGTCDDVAGNVSSPGAQATGINIDKTDPTITASRAPLANPNGWNNVDVTVSYVCDDPIPSDGMGGTQSGLHEPGANDCGNDILSAELAGQSASGTAVDLAGNSASDSITGVNIDKTPPSGSLLISGMTGPGDGTTNRAVSIDVTCNDVLSGCFEADLSGDYTASGETVALALNGLNQFPRDLSQVWGTKVVNVDQFTDLALNSPTPDLDDTDDTKLVAVVNIIAFDPTPTWDLDAIDTEGDAFHLDLSTTDRVWIDSGDGRDPFNATCTVDPGNSDRCTWSEDHRWAAPLDTSNDNTHRITAKIISDNFTPLNFNDDFFLTNATGGHVQDDTAPDVVAVQPRVLNVKDDGGLLKSTTDLSNDFDDLPWVNPAGHDATFPYSNLLSTSWTIEDPNAAIREIDSTPSLNNLGVTYSGDVFGPLSQTTDVLSGSEDEASVTTTLRSDEPGVAGANIGSGKVLTLTLDVSSTQLDYVFTDTITGLEILKHNTSKILNPISSPVAGQLFAVSGLVGDRDFFDDRDDSVANANLSDEFVTFVGTADALGEPKSSPENPDMIPPLSKTQLNGILVEGAEVIKDFETKDGATLLRTDRAIFLPETAKITLPPGVETVVLNAQNVIFKNQKVTLSANIVGSTVPLVETFSGSHQPTATPTKFAQPQFQAIGNTIESIEVVSLSGSLSGASPPGMALTGITLINSTHHPQVLFTGTFNGTETGKTGLFTGAITNSTSSTEPGYVLDGDGFTIFPGMFYETAKSISPAPDEPLQVSTFFRTESGGLPVGTDFFLPVDPSQNYTISDQALGFGITITLNADEDKGFVSYGCIGDADEDGACDGVEGVTDQIEYDLGVTSTGDPVTDFLPLPLGTDYCNRLSAGADTIVGTADDVYADMPAPSTQVKDVWVEIDWGGGAHDPHVEKRKTSNNVLKVDGPQNLCDIITTFNDSPALSSLGGEAGIKLRILGDNSEDVTSGGHLDELTVWTDKDFDTLNSFNEIKLQYLGDSSLRPVLTNVSAGHNIGDGGATGGGADDSITITGLTVESPPGTSGEKTKGEIRLQVHITLGTTTDSIIRTSDAKFDIGWAPAVASALDEFEILASEATATVDSDGDLELLNVILPFEIRNEDASLGDVYDIGTITVPFDLSGTAVTDEDLGWNSPVVVSTKMEAYSQFTHYGLDVHSIGECGPSGSAETDGNDFVISLGCKLDIFESFFTSLDSTDLNGNKRSTGSDEQWKGTFMHELGHNFGLFHGGADVIEVVLNTGIGPSSATGDAFDGTLLVDKDTNPRHFEVPVPFSNPNSGINCKPNYVSVMSYARQLPHTLKGADFDADYSSGHMVGKPGDTSYTLKEGALNEERGLPADTWYDDKIPEIVYGVPQKKQGSSYAAPNAVVTAGTEVNIDWDGDGMIETFNDRQNVNSLSGVNGCGAAGTNFNDWNDWWNLNLNFAGVAGSSFDGAVLQDPNEFDFAGNAAAGSGEDWYDGLLYFNTLNPGGDPDTDNVGPTGSRFDLSFHLLTCDPRNNQGLPVDLCIDTNMIVEQQFFYQDPLNAREEAPAICRDGNNLPDFTQQACVDAGIVELKAVNDQYVTPFAFLCEDALCEELAEDGAGENILIEFFDDGGNLVNPIGDGRGFHQHDNDGVYHFSVLVAEIDEQLALVNPPFTLDGRALAFIFDREISGTLPLDTEFLFDINDDSSIPADYEASAGGEDVTVIISFPGGP